MDYKEANVKKIQEAPRPQTKKHVRSFLELTGFYRAYVPNYSSIVVPPTDLTKKGMYNAVISNVACDKAYIALKTLSLLVGKPVL